MLQIPMKWLPCSKYLELCTFDWLYGLQHDHLLFRNGIYVTVIGSLKEFKGKRQLSAFSVR